MFKRIMCGALVAVCLCAAGTHEVQAFANATSNRSSVTGLVFYSSYDTGDVTFTLTTASGISACTGGFWVRGTDAGAKTVIAALIAASQSGATIVVDADTTQVWPGATLVTCLVWDVRF
jgi:hypothetical protein